MPHAFQHIPVDEVRAFWDRRPCNLRHSSLEIGTREYFEDALQRRFFVEPHIAAFADFPAWRGKRVLEIGCGIGADAVEFARAGAHVTALELSPASLALAKQRAEVYGVSVDFYQGNAEELSAAIPPQKFDLIYSMGVIHHTPHPQRVIAQLPQYMHEASRLKIMLYHRNSTKVWWILLTRGFGAFWRIDELIARHSEAQTGCPVTYAYSRRGLPGLLAPLKVEQVHVDHIFPYRIKDYVQYRYIKKWYYRLLPRPVFDWLKARFGWHVLITARL